MNFRLSYSTSSTANNSTEELDMPFIKTANPAKPQFLFDPSIYKFKNLPQNTPTPIGVTPANLKVKNKYDHLRQAPMPPILD